MSAISTLLCFTLLFHFALVFAWQNSWDGPLNFACPNNRYIYKVESQHNNHREDRQWEYSCRGLPSGASLGHCTWSENANDWDGLLAFSCPGNSVITGVMSHHNNRREDRLFRFRCCALSGRRLEGCYYTGFINDYDRYMSYTLPSDEAIKGMTSVHNNRREDRRWKLQVCRLH